MTSGHPTEYQEAIDSKEYPPLSTAKSAMAVNGSNSLRASISAASTAAPATSISSVSEHDHAEHVLKESANKQLAVKDEGVASTELLATAHSLEEPSNEKSAVGGAKAIFTKAVPAHHTHDDYFDEKLALEGAEDVSKKAVAADHTHNDYSDEIHSLKGGNGVSQYTLPIEHAPKDNLDEKLVAEGGEDVSNKAISAEHAVQNSFDKKSTSKDANTVSNQTLHAERLTSAVSEVLIDEKMIVTGPRPVYPLSKRQLEFLLKKDVRTKPQISVYAENHYIFPVPTAILSYFCPTIRASLKGPLKLECVDKKAASWLLRWMMAGGVDKTYTDASAPTGEQYLVDQLLLVAGLGIGGRLQAELTKKLEDLIKRGTITGTHLDKVFRANAPLPVQELGTNIAYFYVDNILNGTIERAIAHASANPILTAKISLALAARKGKVYKLQHITKKPLTVRQISFIYAFTDKEHDLRKMLARDLLRLIDAEVVTDMKAYKLYAWENNDFEDDMAEAINQNARKRRVAPGPGTKLLVAAAAPAPAANPSPRRAGRRTAKKAAKGTRVASSAAAAPGVPMGPLPKPAPRIESNAILRISGDGGVLRER